MDLQGKVVVVTGSAGGNGRVIALQLAAEGARVVVADRRDQPFAMLPGTIDETVQEIKDAGGDAFGFRFDVREEEQVVALRDEVLGHYGTVDVVINNAGIQYTAPIWEYPTERWDQVMGVNLRGSFLMCKHFLPTLMEKRRGNILNISSAMGRAASPTVAAYGASKAGVDHFTQTLAVELRPYNIAANCLAPSFAVDNPTNRAMARACGDETAGRSSEPAEHYAKAAVWLAKQDAESFTGRIVYSRQLILEQRLCEEWCCKTLRDPTSFFSGPVG